MVLPNDTRPATLSPATGPGSTLRLLSLCIDVAYLLACVLLVPWLLFLILVRRRGLGSMGERLGGIELPPPNGPRVWLHAVSVGELEAALPLIHELDQRGLEVVVSTTTASAQELARRRLPEHRVFYYPVDLGFCVRRALARVQPGAIVLVELELWPNLILAASARGVPVTVVNGRITERSYRRMRRVRPLIAALLARLAHVEVQNDVYGERLRALGAAPERVQVTGNLKFDRSPVTDPAAVRREFAGRYGRASEAPTWIAGSTHDGEEAVLLGAHEELLRELPELLLILAPRHVERAPEVAAAVAERGLTAVLYSAEAVAAQPPQVVIIDSTGELARLYAAADVAYVGGSLIPRGGHNLLEPVLAGTPVLHGPHTENFPEIAALLAAAGAAESIEAGTLGARLRQWLTDDEERARRVSAGRSVIEQHGGAAGRAAERVLALLPSTGERARATISRSKGG